MQSEGKDRLDFGVPVEHNAEGEPCRLVIACETTAVHRMVVDLSGTLAAMVRDSSCPDEVRDAAIRAYEALVQLGKVL